MASKDAHTNVDNLRINFVHYEHNALQMELEICTFLV